jgi:putative Holliday junction resolvase
VAKVLGIDWGSKRVGLATANTEAKLVTPLESWQHTPDILERLKKYCHQQDIKIVVVGLPRGLEGQETAQTREVRQFAKLLAASLQVKIKLQDETLTSVSAANQAGDRDANAAAIIVQDYLSGI